MSEGHDHLVGNGEDQEDQEMHRKMLDEILDEILTKCGDVLRRLGES